MKTLSLSQAKSSLGKIADQAIRGETFLIERNGQFVQLKKAEILEPLESLDEKALRRYYRNKTDAEFENRICRVSESNLLED